MFDNFEMVTYCVLTVLVTWYLLYLFHNNVVWFAFGVSGLLLSSCPKDIPHLFCHRMLRLHMRVYYIHTEKYSPKSYVVNFRTQMSSSQSEERTMVFTREKNYTSNQNRERCFFTCEKNDTSNQKPQRCVSFAPKFPPFIAACSAAWHTFNEKSFTQIVFLT